MYGVAPDNENEPVSDLISLSTVRHSHHSQNPMLKIPYAIKPDDLFTTILYSAHQNTFYRPTALRSSLTSLPPYSSLLLPSTPQHLTPTPHSPLLPYLPRISSSPTYLPLYLTSGFASNYATLTLCSLSRFYDLRFLLLHHRG